MLASPEKTLRIQEQLEQEKDAWHNKPRYGLFSYASNHGFGFRDDPSRTNKRDDTGRVKTAPRNFMGGRPGTAHVSIDAFTRTGYLSQNDEYMDPNTNAQLYRGGSTRARQVASQAFRPSGNGTKQIKAPYAYISDPMEPTRTAVSPKNFMTTKPKKGYGSTTYGHLFSQNAYAIDPFENAKIMDSLERKQHAGKIQDGPFFTTFKKRDHFTTNLRLYRDPPGSVRAVNRCQTADAKFRPFLRSDLPKKGYNCTINKFPEYYEEMEQDKPAAGDKSLSGPWRYTYRELTVPAPSVNTYNIVNRPRRKL